jgi:hypothetical protein
LRGGQNDLQHVRRLDEAEHQVMRSHFVKNLGGRAGYLLKDCFRRLLPEFLELSAMVKPPQSNNAEFGAV